MKRIFIMLLCFRVCSLFAAEPSNSGIIDTGDIVFSWSINGTDMECTLQGKTSGWVGVGFDPTNKMKDANFIIGYVTGNKVVIEDHFGHSPIGHKEDTTYPDGNGKNNVTIIGGFEQDGFTEIKFKIPLNSGDKYDTVLGKGKHAVIFAAGKKDSTSSVHFFKSKGELIIE